MKLRTGLETIRGLDRFARDRLRERYAGKHGFAVDQHRARAAAALPAAELGRMIASTKSDGVTGKRFVAKDWRADAPDATEQAGKKEIYRTFDAGTNTEVTKAARPRMPSVSQLPSDKPTPTRVWLITAAFLVVLSLLFLFLFKGAYCSQNESIENPAPATRSID